MKATGERFTIELQALPGWTMPAAKRLRRFLKAAKRAAGFRCNAARQIKPDVKP